MRIFIITDPQLGWDCVIAAYTELEDALKCCLERSGMDTNLWENYINSYGDFDCAVIHEETLQDKFIAY